MPGRRLQDINGRHCFISRAYGPLSYDPMEQAAEAVPFMTWLREQFQAAAAHDLAANYVYMKEATFAHLAKDAEFAEANAEYAISPADRKTDVVMDLLRERIGRAEMLNRHDLTGMVRALFDDREACGDFVGFLWGASVYLSATAPNGGVTIMMQADTGRVSFAGLRR